MPKEMKTFLVIEDDRSEISIAERAFQAAPAQTQLRVAASELEAMRYLEGKDEFGKRKRFPRPAVILFGLKIPRFSGFAFLHWLRYQAPKACRSIPVVVMSCSGLDEDIERSCRVSSRCDLVAKPVDWGELAQQVPSEA